MKNNITDITNGLVSIIVPCFNHAAYLPDALQSVLDQTYTQWECIIINDASTDNTALVAEKWIKVDNRFKLVNNRKNLGLAESRNVGILLSKGHFILPLDSDDKIAKTYLSSSLKKIESNDSLKLVYTDVICFGLSNEYVERPAFTMNELCHENRIHCTAMFRRIDYDKTDGYRTNMKYGYEDWDFWLQLLPEEKAAAKVAEPLLHIRLKPNSMYRQLTEQREREQAMRQQLIKNNQQIFKRWAPELLPAMGWKKRMKAFLGL